MTGALFLAAALGIGALPEPSHVDREVTTNLALNVSSEISEFSFSLSLFATPSNTVEIAFGEDLDDNGDLSRQETDLIIACECGGLRLVDLKGDVEYEGPIQYGASEINWRVWVPRDDSTVKLRALLNNGTILFANLPRSVPVFKRSWTHMKIVSRGEGDSFDRLTISQSDGWFYIKVR